jgi:hypothetical protein
MAGLSPTQRTLKALREKEYRVGIVERFIGPLNIRVDLFHILDLIAIRPGEILGVQSCGQSFSEHHRKLTQEHPDACLDWLEAGGKLELWGWRKLKVKRGGKAMVWTPRIQVYTAGDFSASYPDNPVEWDRGEEADTPRAARGSEGDPPQAWD